MKQLKVVSSTNEKFHYSHVIFAVKVSTKVESFHTDDLCIFARVLPSTLFYTNPDRPSTQMMDTRKKRSALTIQSPHRLDTIDKTGRRTSNLAQEFFLSPYQRLLKVTFCFLTYKDAMSVQRYAIIIE